MGILDNIPSQVQAWPATAITQPGSLAQLEIIALVLLAVWLFSRLLIRPRTPDTIDHSQPETLDLLFGYMARRLSTPAISLFLLWVAEGVVRQSGRPRNLLHIAIIVLLAWTLTRAIMIVIFSLRKSTNRGLAVILTVTVWIVALLAINDSLKTVLHHLDNISLRIGGARLSLLHLLAGSLILVAFLGLNRVASNAFNIWIKSMPGASPSFQVLSVKLFNAGFFTLAIILALGGLGLDLTNLAWFSGAIGLGLGFGLQKVISNLASGFIILADKSIKPGDVIEVGETFGWVNHLKSRYISVITRDGFEFLIPNEDLITGKVVNWSYSNNLVRVKIPVGVSYGADLELAMKLMLEAAAAVPRVLPKPQTNCCLVGFGDSTVNFQLRVWINDPQKGVTGVHSEVFLQIWTRFHQHGIELPFPQRVLYHKAVPPIKVET